MWSLRLRDAYNQFPANFFVGTKLLVLYILFVSFDLDTKMATQGIVFVSSYNFLIYFIYKVRSSFIYTINNSGAFLIIYQLIKCDLHFIAYFPVFFPTCPNDLKEFGVGVIFSFAEMETNWFFFCFGFGSPFWVFLSYLGMGSSKKEKSGFLEPSQTILFPSLTFYVVVCRCVFVFSQQEIKRKFHVWNWLSWGNLE